MRLGLAGSFLVCAVTAGGMLASIASCRSSVRPAPVSHPLTIDGTQFVPADITVKSGDTLVWENRDPFPHTATAPGGAFDSKEIPPGKSWTYTAGAKGDVPYTCTIHPTMKGIVHVQ
jgi:plastocyanin